jgi:hypothetical protein
LTAPAADAASVLEHELRRLFQGTEITELDRRRVLKLAKAVTTETNCVDAELGVLLSGFRVRGLRSPHYKRKAREFYRDWEPEPTGPAAMKAA